MRGGGGGGLEEIFRVHRETTSPEKKKKKKSPSIQHVRVYTRGSVEQWHGDKLQDNVKSLLSRSPETLQSSLVCRTQTQVSISPAKYPHPAT